MSMLHLLVLIPLLFLLVACSNDDNTGPTQVRWDREICARCAMAVSDRHFAVQIRDGQKGKSNQVYKFDDLGCAVIWLDKQAWKDSPRTEIWITDHQTGDWIDARKAWYVKVNTTPMDYGLGAQIEKTEGALNYEQAKKHVYDIEQNSEHRHSGMPMKMGKGRE